jgi:5S rRNA maturation endonuclease (ribonuclease M5)
MFNIPKNEQQITKELLLKHNSEETYMQTYLGIPVKKGLQVSPLRTDKKPTASFFRNQSNDLIFHDFDGSFYGNFISVVMHLYNCSYYIALKIIANDFGLVEFKGYEKHVTEIKISNTVITEKQSTSNIQVQIKEFSSKELEWWNSFGISKKTLKKFHVFSCENSFLNGFYYQSSSPSSPMYGYYGGKKNEMELWRLYMPSKRTYRFLSNWSSSFLQGAKQLPVKGDNLIITKSLKDVMALYELNIPAIAPCSENIIISPSQFDRLHKKFDNIIILYDNDLAGVRGAHKYKKTFSGIKCVFLKRKYAKDISDVHKKKGLNHFLECETELNEIFNSRKLTQTKHFYVF